jgi:tripartite-type tricarboxylate transporter receptor subunit TctC
MKLFFQTLLLVFSLGVAHTTTAQEQAYPHKLVRIVVPNGAGGPTDLIARIMAQKLSESMGQTFIVENRLGAGGVVGTAAAAVDNRIVHRWIPFKSMLVSGFFYQWGRVFCLSRL